MIDKYIGKCFLNIIDYVVTIILIYALSNKDVDYDVAYHNNNRLHKLLSDLELPSYDRLVILKRIPDINFWLKLQMLIRLYQVSDRASVNTKIDDLCTRVKYLEKEVRQKYKDMYQEFRRTKGKLYLSGEFIHDPEILSMPHPSDLSTEELKEALEKYKNEEIRFFNSEKDIKIYINKLKEVK